MNRHNLIIATIIIVLLGGLLYYAAIERRVFSELTSQNQLTNDESVGNDKIRVTSPTANQTVSSPFTITGQARGTWYFEASFPVTLIDADGNVLGRTAAQAQGEWMTEAFVPFSGELTFSQPATDRGTLILEKDNPSGLPEHADQIRVPVQFGHAQGRTIQVYFYNSAKDTDPSGTVLCSRQGLVAVERQVPITNTPIQDAIQLLLAGGLTSSEKTTGISTDYPLAGITLKGAALTNGVLTLEFTDPLNTTSGGACRSNILWYQIEATAKQFSEVKEVKFKPESLFQP
jgi:hypothetical protein